jgi:hypothetical protein
MRAVVDRIEDGNIAVLTVTGGGEMYLPVKQFGFSPREGMWLSVDIKPDERAGKSAVVRIKKLQGKLLGKAKK